MEIPDETVPLEPPTGGEDESPTEAADDVIDIPEDIPLADVPVTGDMMLVYGAMAAVSGAGMTIVGCKRKKK